MTTSQPLRLGQLDATVHADNADLWLDCDRCDGTLTKIRPGMSLDDLLMAYHLHHTGACTAATEETP